MIYRLELNQKGQWRRAGFIEARSIHHALNALERAYRGTIYANPALRRVKRATEAEVERLGCLKQCRCPKCGQRAGKTVTNGINLVVCESCVSVWELQLV